MVRWNLFYKVLEVLLKALLAGKSCWIVLPLSGSLSYHLDIFEFGLGFRDQQLDFSVLQALFLHVIEVFCPLTDICIQFTGNIMFSITISFTVPTSCKPKTTKQALC